MTEQTRRYIYGIAAAVLPLLVAGGIVTEQHAPLWLAVAGAALVPAMAYKNTNTTPGGKRAKHATGRRAATAADGRRGTDSVPAGTDREEHTAASLAAYLQDRTGSNP